MSTSRLIRVFAVFLLSGGLGGISSAHAANDIAGSAAADRPLTVAPAGTRQPLAQADIRALADDNPGRILFILASSKVHCTKSRQLPTSGNSRS